MIPRLSSKIRNADSSITSYKFYNVKMPRADGSGGICAGRRRPTASIWNGQITDWNQIPISLNGGNHSFQDPAEHAGLRSACRWFSSAAATARARPRYSPATWPRSAPARSRATVYADFSSSTLPAEVRIDGYTAFLDQDQPQLWLAADGVTDVAGQIHRSPTGSSTAWRTTFNFDPNNMPGRRRRRSTVDPGPHRLRRSRTSRFRP